MSSNEKASEEKSIEKPDSSKESLPKNNSKETSQDDPKKSEAEKDNDQTQDGQKKYKYIIVTPVWIILALIIAAILYFLTVALIMTFYSPQDLEIIYHQLCVLSLLGIGLLIYGTLFFLSLRDKKNNDKEDMKTIKKIKREELDAQTFDHLSCRGQMRILTMIQNHDIDFQLNDNNGFKMLAEKVHTPQALDALLDIYKWQDQTNNSLESEQSKPGGT